MPQMSNLDWLMLSFYFISLYWLSLMLMNYLNYSMNFMFKLKLIQVKIFKFKKNWK